MARNKKQERERLFAIYSANLSLYYPEVRDLFLCPICLGEFEEVALRSAPPLLSLAHIVPKFLRGTMVTLACAACNSRVGTQYEQHLDQQQELLRWKTGKTSRKWKLSHKNAPGVATAEITRDLKGWDIRMLASHSNPKELKLFEEVFKSQSAFEIKGSSRGFDPRKRTVALIAAAWLAMFRMFGYEYVLNENTQQIREYVHNPGKDYTLNKLVWSSSTIWPKLPADFEYHVSVVANPEQYQGFAVTLPPLQGDSRSMTVMLPGFGDCAMRSFENVLALARPVDSVSAKLILERGMCHLADANSESLGCHVWRELLG